MNNMKVIDVRIPFSIFSEKKWRWIHGPPSQCSPVQFSDHWVWDEVDFARYRQWRH